ncbi:MAG: CvpA family protein, partial [Enterococcus thailandicus]|nr:CvpA family protein [Enterococcus thailandicus]
MLSLLIIIFLLIAFFSGAKRGFALQVVYTVGYLVSFLVAQHFYKQLANHLELYIPYPAVTPTSDLVFFDQTISFSLDQAFYAGIAFLLILMAGWLITRFVGIFVHSLTYLPVLKQVDWLAGGLLSVVVTFVMIFLLLSLLSFVPSDFIQNQFRSSGLARY